MRSVISAKFNFGTWVGAHHLVDTATVADVRQLVALLLLGLAPSLVVNQVVPSSIELHNPFRLQREESQ